MRVIVATKDTDTTKQKGDLLENIAEKLLAAQNYEVERQLNNTGVELDLLCKPKAHPSKQVYVECKAYAENNKIQADVIKALYATRGIKRYYEAWLISTSEIGKDAKGLINDIENGDESSHFMFYTPKKLVSALTDASVIQQPDTFKHTLINKVGKAKLSEDPTLLICEFGYFWIFEHLAGGKPAGLFFAYAKTSELVTEPELLDNIASLKTPFQTLDHRAASIVIGQAFSPKAANSNTAYRLNASYLSKISDPGLKISHPEKTSLVLDDIFTFPDLEEMGTDDKKRLPSKTVLFNLKSDKKQRVLILGEDLSGKTSLARFAQKATVSMGKIAIYINATEVKQPGQKNFISLLVKNFRKQFDNPSQVDSLKTIIAENPDRVTILIDDFEQLAVKQATSRALFMKMLRKHFPNTILFANKSLELESVARASTKEIFEGFGTYRILQLGHMRRDELIEKWLTVSQKDTLEDSFILNKKVEISKRISTAVGTNFIPTYPFYLLTILHLFESGTKSKLQGSSYAELYGYLINQSLLSAQAKPEDLDFYHTYLSHVAYEFFKRGVKSIPVEEMRPLFIEYSDRMDLKKSFDDVHRLLGRAKLINVEDGYYFFQHSYTHYYFIAKYFSDNIETETVKTQISQITQKLYINEYANIVIFLIHHSRNKNLIEEILRQSRELFKEVPAHTLSREELTNVNGLIQEELMLAYRNGDPGEYRKEELQKKDQLESSQEDDTDASEERELDLFVKTNFAFKIIEVLGQVTNNYYGSLDGESKAKIVEELYSLGLRGLNAFLKSMDEYMDAIRQDLDAIFEKKNTSSAADKTKEIDRVIYSFTQVVVYVFMKRMSDSIASANLFPTIDKVTDRHQTIAAKLMNISVKLNFPNELIENRGSILNLHEDLNSNFLPRDLLRITVLNHLYKFDISFAEKQRICAKLGIKFVQNPQLITAKI